MTSILFCPIVLSIHIFCSYLVYCFLFIEFVSLEFIFICSILFSNYTVEILENILAGVSSKPNLSRTRGSAYTRFVPNSVKKCDYVSFAICLPPGLSHSVFSTLYHLPDPVRNGEHYKPFDELSFSIFPRNRKWKVCQKRVKISVPPISEL